MSGVKGDIYRIGFAQSNAFKNCQRDEIIFTAAKILVGIIKDPIFVVLSVLRCIEALERKPDYIVCPTAPAN